MSFQLCHTNEDVCFGTGASYGSTQGQDKSMRCAYLISRTYVRDISLTDSLKD